MKYWLTFSGYLASMYVMYASAARNKQTAETTMVIGECIMLIKYA